VENKNFTIQTDVFEGPLSLLLELVQKRRIFIGDISLADIAEEFIQAMQKQPERREALAEQASFVHIAATLLLLKSKSLLPNFAMTDEEEEDAIELAKRLMLFERIRTLSSVIKGAYGNTVCFLGAGLQHNELNAPFFSPEERFSGALFLNHIRAVRAAVPKRETIEQLTIQQTVRLEDVLIDLTARVKKYAALSFKEFAKVGEASRGEVVVRFIALLELVKRGFLQARQSIPGGDIELRREEVSVPNYAPKG
jgi:segregation and condensation protein A